MDESYITRNKETLDRMQRLLVQLNDEDYGREIGHGWTVVAALAHLAFWDRITLTRLEEWEHSGKRPERLPDAVNDARLEQWRAMPPQEAAREVVEAAEAVDRKISALAPELREEILAEGYPRLLDRSLHRREHLEEIERVVPLG